MGLDGLQLVQAPVQLLQGLDRKADVLVVCNKIGYERYRQTRTGMEEGYARDGGGYLGPVWSQWGHFGLEG